MSSQRQFIEKNAATWLARCDRDLTPEEQDQYLQWLREDPQHAAAVARLEKNWKRLDVLSQWQPHCSKPANPDLLRGTAKRTPWLLCVTALGCAAAVAFLFTRPYRTGQHGKPGPSQTEQAGIVRHEPEHMVLPDGSIVELKAGAKVEPVFEPHLRRVRLIAGEAHFTVAKNPARPFVVEANGVDVRAVGTAFSVHLETGQVAVLVTEGKVRLDRPATPEAEISKEEALQSPVLAAGQRAIIDTTIAAKTPVITPVDAAEIEQSLAWEGLRLELTDVPLSRVIEEFNLYNRRQLVVADAETASVHVGGSFRADNVDAFVRLLESSLGITAAVQPDGTTVLGRSRPIGVKSQEKKAPENTASH